MPPLSIKTGVWGETPTRDYGRRLGAAVSARTRGRSFAVYLFFECRFAVEGPLKIERSTARENKPILWGDAKNDIRTRRQPKKTRGAKAPQPLSRRGRRPRSPEQGDPPTVGRGDRGPLRRAEAPNGGEGGGGGGAGAPRRKRSWGGGPSDGRGERAAPGAGRRALVAPSPAAETPTANLTKINGKTN